jgi:hypothetical protein
MKGQRAFSPISGRAKASEGERSGEIGRLVGTYNHMVDEAEEARERPGADGGQGKPRGWKAGLSRSSSRGRSLLYPRNVSFLVRIGASFVGEGEGGGSLGRCPRRRHAAST